MIVVITGGNSGIAQGIKSIFSTFSNYDIYTPNRSELDVTLIDSVISYMSKIKPDILINCAGYIKPSKIIDSDDNELDKHYKVNLFGAYICSKYALKNGCKTIIQIGSTSAFEGRSEWGFYCCVKAGLASLTETLAKEGVNCYAIHPARTNTKMRDSLFPEEDKIFLMKPERIGEFVLDCLRGKFLSGSHIIVKKDYFYVLPMRECPK
jgi:3-oxoacyl-[acyl-carrier protein] reductase